MKKIALSLLAGLLFTSLFAPVEQIKYMSVYLTIHKSKEKKTYLAQEVKQKKKKKAFNMKNKMPLRK